MITLRSATVEDHPRPFMETAFPHFYMYPGVPQNLMRPTWKGVNGLRGVEHGGAAGYLSPSVLWAILRAEQPVGVEEIAVPATSGVQVTAVFPDAGRPIVSYSHAISWARIGLIGIPVALAVGVGLGFWLGRRKRR